MAGAEFATGSIEVRRSSPIHRLLNFLGAFFLGIGPAAAPTRSTENWWEREPTDTPMTLGRQAEMFDEAGQVTIAAKPAPAVKPAASRAIVSVQSRSRTTARVVATTRVQAATRVMAAPQTAARGEVARHLFMSKSLSSGKEGSRWFSVPQRVLLPRYQLFEGVDAVIEERPGQWRIGSPSLRQQRGQVWFV